MNNGLGVDDVSPMRTEPIPVKSPPVMQSSSLPSEIESGVNGRSLRRRKSVGSQLSLRDGSDPNLSEPSALDRIAFELNSIALDWRSYHASPQCNCALPFDTAQRKVRREKKNSLAHLFISVQLLEMWRKLLCTMY